MSRPPKHPRLVRWTHWLNSPLFFLMVWSGLKIYWANPAYVDFSDRLYSLLKLDYSLADGMAIHFFVGWLFVLNGLVYVGFTLFSGEWRELAPKRTTWREIPQVVLHDLHLRSQAPPQGRYNAAQRLAYTAAILAGAGLVVTGFAIYKPDQLRPLTALLGGYRAARAEHFGLMVFLLAFFVVHVLQVARAGWRNLRAMLAGLPEPPVDDAAERALTRRALLTGAVSTASGALGWAWLTSRPEVDGAPAPLRGALSANGRLWGKLFRASCRAPASAAAVRGKDGRVNGDLGLEGELDTARWRLRVVGRDGRESALRLDDIKRLPRLELTTNLNCIEGWSDENSFAGARFSDLVDKLKLEPARYVGLETPDRGYYVSLDIQTMLHPQTLLVYEMNGKPLSADHGAPLRLFTPLKYGIKSIKRVGVIRFSDSRPPDYWEERGYDWYAGL